MNMNYEHAKTQRKELGGGGKKKARNRKIEMFHFSGKVQSDF